MQLPDFASISSLLTLHKADTAGVLTCSIYLVLTLAFAQLQHEKVEHREQPAGKLT